MARFDLCSGFYTSTSPLADAEMCRNWYPEVVESEGGKSKTILLPRPGLVKFASVSDKPVRGMCAFTPPNTSTERYFAVIGPKFYEFDKNGNVLRTQAVKNDGLPVTFACGQTQLLIQSADTGYVFTFATNAWLDLSTGGPILGPISMVEYADGFFFALLKNSNKYQISVNLDATTWPGLQTNAVSWFEDNIRSFVVDHGELLVAGSRKSLAYYDSGSLNIYDVSPNSRMEKGIAGALARAKLDNTVYWVQADERGQGVVVKLAGYSPQRVSTHAIENVFQAYSSISDCIAFPFQINGHEFLVLQFPTANATWVYDAANGFWHEWTSMVNGKEQAFLGQTHQFAFGKHLVGDRLSGTIYEMKLPTISGSTWTFCDDNGTPIRRTRRSPYIAKESEWIYFSNLEIEGEFGLGPQPPFRDGQGNPIDPMLMLRWSNDGTKTWSDEVQLKAGKAGQFGTRMRLFRLGRCWGTRGRVFEISTSDAVPWRIVDGHIIASGFEAQKRLIAQFRESA